MISSVVFLTQFLSSTLPKTYVPFLVSTDDAAASRAFSRFGKVINHQRGSG
jgi:hypothetical protein